LPQAAGHSGDGRPSADGSADNVVTLEEQSINKKSRSFCSVNSLQKGDGAKLRDVFSIEYVERIEIHLAFRAVV
jgi:hypothetical protein